MGIAPTAPCALTKFGGSKSTSTGYRLRIHPNAAPPPPAGECGMFTALSRQSNCTSQTPGDTQGPTQVVYVKLFGWLLQSVWCMNILRGPWQGQGTAHQPIRKPAARSRILFGT